MITEALLTFRVDGSNAGKDIDQHIMRAVKHELVTLFPFGYEVTKVTHKGNSQQCLIDGTITARAMDDRATA